MARGDHPQRTPLYGALMLVAVWWAGATVTLLHATTAVKVVVLIVAVPVALVGFVMTFRDLS